MMQEKEKSNSSNYVSLLLLPCDTDAGLDQEPHVFHQKNLGSVKGCLWIPGCVVPEVTEGFVLWNDWAPSLEEAIKASILDGCNRCTEAMLSEDLPKKLKSKMHRVRNTFLEEEQPQGLETMFRCNAGKSRTESGRNYSRSHGSPCW